VNDIPNALLSTFAQQGSVHASSIYKGTSNEEERRFLGQWIRENLVSPTEFQLDHDHSLPPNLSANLEVYRPQFLHRGFEMWDVENDDECNYRFKFAQQNDVTKVFLLSGRPDFVITRAAYDGVVALKTDCSLRPLCIVVVQSKHRDRDIPFCEVQLQLYLMLAMNKLNLSAVVGFLVQDNGMCRSYKASRARSIMYEQNDLVHVSRIADVLHSIALELGLLLQN